MIRFFLITDTIITFLFLLSGAIIILPINEVFKHKQERMGFEPTVHIKRTSD